MTGVAHDPLPMAPVAMAECSSPSGTTVTYFECRVCMYRHGVFGRRYPVCIGLGRPWAEIEPPCDSRAESAS